MMVCWRPFGNECWGDTVKRIVITGATGFIGVHLIHTWLREEAEIYAVIRSNSKNADLIPVSARVHVVACEMSDYEQLSELIPDADFFYHLAWEGARAPLRDNAALQKKNFECSVKAMDAANRMGCEFFLGSGSQAEYGNTSGIVDEEYPCNPTTAYGREKLRTQKELQAMARNYAMRFIWARIFSIYGPHDYPGTLIMSALDKMKRGEMIEMTAGTQLWDYLYVEDAANAMKLFALQNCEDGIYNVASGDYRPLNQYLTAMKRVLGSESELKFGAVPYGPNGPVNLTPSVEKIQKAIYWRPKMPFEDGIRKMVL